MGSSAQNSSHVHWCRRRVRFNEIPEKVLGGFGAEPGQVQQGSGEGSGEGLGGFGAEPTGFRRRFRRRSGRLWCRCRVRFNEVPEKVCMGSFGAEPGQIQRRSGQGSGEGLGGFGAEPGQVPETVPKKVPEKVPEKVAKKVPEKVWEALVHSQVRFNRDPEKVREKVPVREALVQSQVKFNRVPKKVPEKVPVREALVQSQVQFNRVPKKVPEKVLGGFGAEPGQVQQGSEQGSGEGSGEGSGRLWCRARSGSTGFRRRFGRKFREALVQSQGRFNGFRRRFRRWIY